MDLVDAPEVKENPGNAEEINDDYHPQGQVLIILVGLIGSGKTTFSKAVEAYFPLFERRNQDELKDRKRVERLVIKSLSDGRSAIVDRTNIDSRQRKIWIDIARRFNGVSVWVITMNTPYKVCAERLRTRIDHPTIKSFGVAQSVLNRFKSEFETPSLLEDFDRMYDLEPHTTGVWTRQDIIKVLHEIETSPSTRLESQKSSLGGDLALYVGLPVAIAISAIGAAHHFLSKPSSNR
ncbi:hypothetical protein M408DRAFT_325891 [Serendipita vermifera MAFF 305830]|uniref:P-loop containing nucleoside triphosphate hydrolase protein n=1 Tax=Serendipita vermifera MAFF 305830 TaxID=933852 RepID=A0A0C3BCF2_SERVB|nr:hypothetical protein M408DRAFT_325891 [Serendipita vermifera MAFF 305830]